MKKVVIISDTHSLHHQMTHKIPDGDILIHCGDITGNGSVTHVLNFLQWFESHPHDIKIFIGGNHDGVLEDSGRNTVRGLCGPNTHYLENDYLEVAGLKIYGSPFTPEFNGWHFMKQDLDLSRIWSIIPPELDILITHGPAYGILDYVPPSRGNNGGNVGSKTLLDRLQEIKVKYHLSGHIHAGYGKVKQDKTTFINASTCNEQYEPVNKPWVIKI